MTQALMTYTNAPGAKNKSNEESEDSSTQSSKRRRHSKPGTLPYPTSNQKIKNTCNISDESSNGSSDDHKGDKEVEDYHTDESETISSSASSEVLEESVGGQEIADVNELAKWTTPEKSTTFDDEEEDETSSRHDVDGSPSQPARSVNKTKKSPMPSTNDQGQSKKESLRGDNADQCHNTCGGNNGSDVSPTSPPQQRRPPRRPGAHAVAGIRAFELNSYRSASLTGSHPEEDIDERDVFDEEEGADRSRIFSPSRQSDPDSNIASSAISATSNRNSALPIQMEHVTVLCDAENDEGNNNQGNKVQQSIVGTWEDSSSKGSESGNDDREKEDETADVCTGESEGDAETAIRVKVETRSHKLRLWTQSRQGKLFLVSSVLLVLAAIVISVTVSFFHKNPIQILENAANKESDLSLIQNTLVEHGALTNREALDDTTSIEHKIVSWLAYEDPEQVSATSNPERLVQRYTARFLSITLLEQPGYAQTLEDALADDEAAMNDKDGTQINGGTISTKNAASMEVTERTNCIGTGCKMRQLLKGNSKRIMHLNVSQHECMWAVHSLDVTQFLQMEEEYIMGMVQDDDFIYDDDAGPGGFEIIGLQSNLTIECNAQQQVTGLSIAEVSLPREQALPSEIGTLVHLEEVRLIGVSFDQNMTNPSLVRNILDRLPNLTKLELDMVGPVGSGKSRDMKVHIEGIHNLTKLSILKLSGGEAPISSEIAQLPHLTELSIQQFRSGTKSLFPSDQFFRYFASQKSLKKLEVSNNRAPLSMSNDIRVFGNLTHLIYSKNNRNLKGSIPSIALSKLTNLVHLDLSANKLESYLPPTLTSSLTQLKYLDVSRNHLIGIIPPGIERLYQLEYLNVESNELEGTFPSGMSSLPKLKEVRFTRNKFSGLLLENAFEGMKSLEKFVASWNGFTGQIPSTIGTLINISHIDLSHNNLSGEIPYQLFDGNSNMLTNLNLQGNPLSSTLPVTLSKATNLVELHLDDTSLKGTLPPLDKLLKLEVLSLVNNQFTGVMPALPASLRVINLKNNGFIALPNHIQLLALTNLVEFEAPHNNLRGSVPCALFRLPNLAKLNLKNNELSELWSLTCDDQLEASSSSSSRLSSPQNKGTDIITSSLADLDLSFNLLEGPLPEGIGYYLSFIEDLHLQHNNFTSNIPSSIGQMKELKHLEIGSNILRGTLPDVFQNTRKLKRLIMNNNDLSGTIPYSILYLDGLQTMILEGNKRLTGNLDPFCTIHQNTWEVIIVPSAIQCSCCMKTVEVPVPIVDEIGDGEKGGAENEAPISGEPGGVLPDGLDVPLLPPENGFNGVPPPEISTPFIVPPMLGSPDPPKDVAARHSGYSYSTETSQTVETSLGMNVDQARRNRHRLHKPFFKK